VNKALLILTANGGVPFSFHLKDSNVQLQATKKEYPIQALEQESKDQKEG
jgi:hypothetical protein